MPKTAVEFDVNNRWRPQSKSSGYVITEASQLRTSTVIVMTSPYVWVSFILYLIRNFADSYIDTCYREIFHVISILH